jgi:hypothetical protein
MLRRQNIIPLKNLTRFSYEKYSGDTLKLHLIIMLIGYRNKNDGKIMNVLCMREMIDEQVPAYIGNLLPEIALPQLFLAYLFANYVGVIFLFANGLIKIQKDTK